MFSVISGLRPDQFQPMPGTREGQMAELASRTAVLAEVVKGLALAAGISQKRVDEIQVTHGKDFSATHASIVYPSMILLPAACFIDFERDFQIHNYEELRERLSKADLVDDTVYRISEIFGWEKPQTINAKFGHALQCFQTGLLIEDREKALNVTRFSILHEMGHLVHNESWNSSIRECGETVLVMGSVLATMALFVTKVVNPLLLSSLSGWVVLPMIVTAGIIAGFSLKIFAQFVRSRMRWHASEIEADRFAACALKGEEGEKIRKGGIDFLYSCMIQSPYYESDTTSFYERFQKHLEHLKTTHPPDVDRIKALRNLGVA